MDNRSIYTQRGSTCSHSIGVYYYDDGQFNNTIRGKEILWQILSYMEITIN